MRAPNIMTKYWKTNDKKPTYAAIVKDKKGKSITELKMSITTLAIIKIPITKYIHSKALYKSISLLLSSTDIMQVPVPIWILFIPYHLIYEKGCRIMIKIMKWLLLDWGGCGVNFSIVKMTRTKLKRQWATATETDCGWKPTSVFKWDFTLVWDFYGRTPLWWYNLRLCS